MNKTSMKLLNTLHISSESEYPGDGTEQITGRGLGPGSRPRSGHRLRSSRPRLSELTRLRWRLLQLARLRLDAASSVRLDKEVTLHLDSIVPGSKRPGSKLP